MSSLDKKPGPAPNESRVTFTRPPEPDPVDVRLVELATLFRERDKVHGSTFMEFGGVMAGLFPEGLTCRTEEEWTRLGVLIQIAHKLARYCTTVAAGTPGERHVDSLNDLSVYAQMGAFVDETFARRRNENDKS